MKVFWIIYELVLLVGAVAWGLLIYKHGRLYKNGKQTFGDRVRKLAEKMEREDAIHYMQFKMRASLISCASCIAIEFVFVYVIVDLFFRHIIGG